MEVFIWFLLFFSIRAIKCSKLSDADNRPTNPLWQSTWTDKLKQDLLLHYDKFSRPKQHTKNITIDMNLSLMHFEMDEKRSVISIHAWVMMKWEDEKLKWNSSDYGGMTLLHLADHEIWQPDIVPYNSATGSKLDFYGNVNLLVRDNGTVLWVPPTIFQILCAMDFTEWPFDTQECGIKLGSWTHDGEGIDINCVEDRKTTYEVEDLIPNAEWNFIKMYTQKNTNYYKCCPEPYIDIKFDLTVQRRSGMYTPFIIIPALVIILTTLATFWLPPTSGDKLTLAGTAIVTALLILFYLVQKVPVMTGNTPYVVTFYSRCLYLVSFAVVVAVVNKNIAQNPKDTPLPWIFKKNLKGWLGKYLFIGQSEQQNLSKSAEIRDSQLALSEEGRHICVGNSESHQKDWTMLAIALDRIFFIFYCFAFCILVIIYTV